MFLVIKFSDSNLPLALDREPEKRHRTSPNPGKFIAFPVLVAALCLPLATVPAQNVDRVLEILRDARVPRIDESASLIDPKLISSWRASTSSEASDALLLPEPEFHLRNGNRILGQLSPPELPFRTPYGVLQLPTTNLVEVRLFILPSREVREKLDRAVAGLGDSDFRTREQSAEALRELFPDSFPRVREALKSDDEEIREQAERLLAEFGRRLNRMEDSASPILDGRDKIIARESSMRGLVELDRFAVQTRYGELELPRHSVERIIFRHRREQSGEAVVPASSVASGDWLKTSIQATKGRPLKIEAGGQLRVPDWDMSCGPDGSQYHSRLFPGYRMLTLVGKIGEAGGMFRVGSLFDDRAMRSGTLFLAIVPFRYSASLGSYKVKIDVR